MYLNQKWLPATKQQIEKPKIEFYVDVRIFWSQDFCGLDSELV